MEFERNIQACESCFRREVPVEDSNVGIMWDLMELCAARRAAEPLTLDEIVTTVSVAAEPSVVVNEGIDNGGGMKVFVSPKGPTATATGVTSVLAEMYATRHPSPVTLTVTPSSSTNTTAQRGDSSSTQASVSTHTFTPMTLVTSISRPSPAPPHPQSPATLTILPTPETPITIKELYVPPNHNDKVLLQPMKRSPPPRGFVGLPLEMRCIDCVKWDCSRSVWLTRGCSLDISSLGGSGEGARPELAPILGVEEGQGDGFKAAEPWTERMLELQVDIDGLANNSGNVRNEDSEEPS